MEPEVNNLFVCLMGICTVFIGLICIIILVTVMSNIVRKVDRSDKKSVVTDSKAVKAVPAADSSGKITPELAAAVSAVIAEEMGTDASGIRIVSFKKVSA